MTDQLPPILSYQKPTPTTPNFGTRMAMVSWLASLAALLMFLMMLARSTLGPRNSDTGYEFCGFVLLVMGVLSSVVALVTMLRYGRKGILRPAIVGLCLSLVGVPLLVGLLIWWLVARS